MNRIVIIGNSGSGKTSLARRLSSGSGIPLLDLDNVAWSSANPPVRAPLEQSFKSMSQFMDQHRDWIIEGCYASLIAHAAPCASRLYFLNQGMDVCISNCRSRPWEPSKYESKEAQDRNLTMLIDWVKSYTLRNDEFGLQAHQKVFDHFSGRKFEIKSNREAQSLTLEMDMEMDSFTTD